MILLCDHRGLGLEARLAPLRTAGFTLDATQGLLETRERLAFARPALVVLDPLAPGGLVELEDLERLGGAAGRPPLLLVADPEDSRAALSAARALGGGPWDLVHRDAPVEEYAVRIERLLAQAEQVGELDDLRYHAAHDDRTELLRPRFFDARLQEQVSAAQRHGFDLALVLLDLDRFGRINKEHDHTVGDLVIARVGRAVRECLRAEDVAGRLGGDEFAVILPFAGPLEAAAAVQRLASTLRALSGRVGAPELELEVSASLGFETLRGGQVDSAATLRRHAELALRHAKRCGGDRGVYYRSLQR
ncbi:MAG: GGDEF domain-containing protein [Planctomycetes bacterium]|nr:GGDEF domain-containing protein [Planctomycetota bacterium]